MEFYVANETAPLESVVLGIGTNRGKPRSINPTMRMHLKNNTAPTEEDICQEISTFEQALVKHGVDVFRPQDISDVEQIFSRDIGFVIEDYFFIANMKHEVREAEFAGIANMIGESNSDKVIQIPEGAVVEGGDVILHNDYVFVGISDRTNEQGLAFLKDFFPKKHVIGFPLVVDQNNSERNILHLDCTFQPIGTDQAIIFLDGFVNQPKVLLEIFPEEKRIEVSQEEKSSMFPNVFSISPTKIVVERQFQRLKNELKDRGFEVIEVDYSETSKLSGLLRCSTLPLRRKKS